MVSIGHVEGVLEVFVNGKCFTSCGQHAPSVHLIIVQPDLPFVYNNGGAITVVLNTGIDHNTSGQDKL